MGYKQLKYIVSINRSYVNIDFTFTDGNEALAFLEQAVLSSEDKSLNIQLYTEVVGTEEESEDK